MAEEIEEKKESKATEPQKDDDYKEKMLRLAAEFDN